MALRNAGVEENVAVLVGEESIIVVEKPDRGDFPGEVIEVNVYADNAYFRIEFEQRNDIRNHVDGDVLVQVGHHPSRLFRLDRCVIPADMLDIAWIVFRKVCGLCKLELVVSRRFRHENAGSRRSQFRIESQVDRYCFFGIADGEPDEFPALFCEFVELFFVSQLPETVQHSANRNF